MKAENDFPPTETVREAAGTVLGYLNFSSGSEDPKFLRALNMLYAEIAERAMEGPAGEEPLWKQFHAVLREELDFQTQASSAFARSDQACAVLDVVFNHVLPGYLAFHQDLLAHQSDETLFQPLFIGRVCEAVLREGGPFDDVGRVVPGAIARLNDYIGYRPVAVLHNRQRMKPYDHEWHRPLPLYIRTAGVAWGRYRALIEKAVEMLSEVPPDILRSAWFDPDNLDEIALDVRAYDFEHPVHRRPNYMFGQWDPNLIDNRGYYRRFVLHQVTLDAIAHWYEESLVAGMPEEEALFEASAVVVGTMLMGSGVSGDGPEAHDSDTSLGDLLQEIAEYRDRLYEQWLDGLGGEHGERLREEARQLHQPFGGVRQSLNQQLARQRTEQLQRVRIAAVYARLGHAEAAMRLARSVLVPSARFESQIMCTLSGIQKALDRVQRFLPSDGDREPDALARERLEETAAAIPRIRDLLIRGIECGAVIDPWNILGFDAHFSLFPALENSIHDERADDLIDMMDAIFSAMTDVEKQSVAAGRDDLREKVVAAHEEMARWWDQFATMEVSEVEGLSGADSFESAEHVTTAMRQWYQAGVGAGDVAFWSRHVDSFETAEAHAVVVDALLDQNDTVASMALLMQWLSRHEEVPLVEGYNSFHKAAMRWMEEVWRNVYEPKDTEDDSPEARRRRLENAWTQTQKFFDYLEAGSEELWEVPTLDLAAAAGASPEREPGEGEDEGGEESLFEAAYENVVYRDSTDDGIDSEMVEGTDGLDDFELTAEADRISRRLSFLRMLAYLWRLAATASMEVPQEERRDVLAAWADLAEKNRRGLLALLATVGRYPIPAPRVPNDEAMAEYDKRQALKEQFLDRAIQACIDTSDVARVIRAAAGMTDESTAADWEAPAGRHFAGPIRFRRRRRPQGMADLPLGRPQGTAPVPGDLARRKSRESRRRADPTANALPVPHLSAADRAVARNVPTVCKRFRSWSATIRPARGRLPNSTRCSKSAYQAIIRCAVASFRALPEDRTAERADVNTLIRCLERITEPLIYSWVTHGRNTRLSPLEAIRSENDWKRLKQFVENLRRRPVHPGVPLIRQRPRNSAPGSRRLSGARRGGDRRAPNRV